TLPEETKNKLNEHRQKIRSVLTSLSKDHSQDTNEECDRLKQNIEELHDFYLAVEKERDVFNQLLIQNREMMNKINSHDKITFWQWIAGITISILISVIASKFL
ncbi:MAG: hypothetical protein LBQ50_07630, partial [Planctomycetaceae bacterium]|nr:hypothetical protein [Planctomycetaceae bacterium]